MIVGSIAMVGRAEGAWVVLGFIFGDFLLGFGVLGGVLGVFWGLSGGSGACEGAWRWFLGFLGGCGVL